MYEIKIDPVKKIGRPTKLTSETIQKLLEGYSIGCNDVQACLYAGITASCLYEYQKKNPSFVELKAHFKENPVLKAKAILLKGMEDKPELALKVLEKLSKQYQQQQKVQLEHKGLESILHDLMSDTSDQDREDNT